MCNLNLFVKTHKKNSDILKKIVSLLEVTSFRSCLTNKDGEGFYFDYDNSLIKSQKKLNLLKYDDLILKSRFILGHERLATQGFKDAYIQPFKENGFVLLHNGVLRNYEDEKHSDSFLFFEEFNKHFNKAKGKTKEEKIINSLTLLLEKAQGSFSICLFDTKQKNLYYIKNSSTHINFYLTKNKEELFISTQDNKDILDIYRSDFKTIEVKPHKIYKVNIENKKINVKIVGKLKITPIYTIKNHTLNDYSRVSYVYNSSHKKKSFHKKKTPENLVYNLDLETKSFLKRVGFEEKRKIKKCCICKEKTNLYNKKENHYYCFDCFEELFFNYT